MSKSDKFMIEVIFFRLKPLRTMLCTPETGG